MSPRPRIRRASDKDVQREIVRERARRRFLEGGFGFGFSHRIAVASPDPGAPIAAYSLAGWWSVGATDYSASPWVGRASAGSSGSRNLSEATNPPSAGTAINAHVPPDFDGTNDILSSTLGDTTYFSLTAWSMMCVFRADTATAGGLPRYLQPSLITDSGQSYWILNFDANGVHAGHFDGTTSYDLAKAASTGTVHLVNAWYDGSSINLEVDGAAATPVAAANAVNPGANTLRIGSNYNATSLFDGRIAEVIVDPTDLGSTFRTATKTYCNAVYGTTF